MTRKILAAFIKDAALLAGKGLFETKTASRESLIAREVGKHYPEALVKYLRSASAANFAADLGKLADKQGKSTTGIEMALKEFYLSMTQEDLEKSRGGYLGQVLKWTVQSQTVEQISRQIRLYLSRYSDVSFWKVQSPRDMDTHEAETIRKNIAKISKNPFVEFSVSGDLLGGVRVFAEGKMYDASWLKQVKQVSRSVKL